MRNGRQLCPMDVSAIVALTTIGDELIEKTQIVATSALAHLTYEELHTDVS